MRLVKKNEEKILIKGIRVNLRITGEGKPFLILHGWGGSSDSWDKVQRLLSLAKYRVIVPDLPGFGKTKTPRKAWGVGDYGDFIFELTEKLNLDNFYLLGHSFGGRIAVKFAVSYPDKVKKLILCDAAGIKPKWYFKNKLIFTLARIGNAVFTPKLLSRFKDGARNFFYKFLRHYDYVKAEGTMKETIKKVLQEDLFPELAKIKIPTLIIWGRKDKLVPVKYAYDFYQEIENSKIVILRGIGHSPHLEVPDVLAAQIIGFLRNQK